MPVNRNDERQADRRFRRCHANEKTTNIMPVSASGVR